MSHSVYLYQPVSLSPSSQSVPSSSSHSLVTLTASSLPFHNISSSAPSTALDIQHFLQPFTVISGVICSMSLGSTMTEYYIYISWFSLLTYLSPWRVTISSTDGVSGVTNFKYMCFVFVCCVCGLVSLSSWTFLWFLICWLVQVLFLSLVVNFYFFNSHFPVTTLGSDLFSGAYHNKLLFLWFPVTENRL